MTAVNEGVTLEIIGTHQGRIVALVGGQPFAATTRDLLSALSTLIEYDRETVTVHGYGARSCPRPMPAISPPGPYGCASMGAIRRRASRSTRWPLTTPTYPLPGRGKRPVPACPSRVTPCAQCSMPGLGLTTSPRKPRARLTTKRNRALQTNKQGVYQ